MQVNKINSGGVCDMAVCLKVCFADIGRPFTD